MTEQSERLIQQKIKIQILEEKVSNPDFPNERFFFYLENEKHERIPFEYFLIFSVKLNYPLSVIICFLFLV